MTASKGKSGHIMTSYAPETWCRLMQRVRGTFLYGLGTIYSRTFTAVAYLKSELFAWSQATIISWKSSAVTAMMLESRLSWFICFLETLSLP